VKPRPEPVISFIDHRHERIIAIKPGAVGLFSGRGVIEPDTKLHAILFKRIGRVTRRRGSCFRRPGIAATGVSAGDITWIVRAPARWREFRG
jgi:hypothetical protein